MLNTAAITPTIPASDMDRAKKYYEEILGLKPGEEFSGGIIYECGKGTTLFLYPSAGAGSSQATYASWEIPDLEAEMAELRSKGVQFEEYDFPEFKTVNGVATGDGIKSAWFKDSEGNILNIGQRA